VENDPSSLSLAPFQVSLGVGTVVPPYTTTTPGRAVEVTVDKPALATVQGDKRSLNLLGEGTVQVTVSHPATQTQAAVSATALMTITARVPAINGLPESIVRTWTGVEQTIVLTPSSQNTANTTFQLSSTDDTVASVNGLTV